MRGEEDVAEKRIETVEGKEERKTQGKRGRMESTAISQVLQCFIT